MDCMDWNLFWGAIGAISNGLIFFTVIVGVILTLIQLSAMKETRALDLLLQIEDRMCSADCQKLMSDIKGWDKSNLKDEQKEKLIDLIGIFELLGLTIDKGHANFEDTEIMFGSKLIRIYDDYGYKSFIEEKPSYFNYTKKFVERVRKVRNERG